MEFKWFVEVMYVTPIRPVQSYAVIPLALQNWLNFYNHSLQPGFFSHVLLGLLCEIWFVTY